MPYVQRDESGKITGQYANLQYGYAEEWLDDDATELQPSIDDHKAIKRDGIRAAYAIAALTNVTALSFEWNGGFESAIKLDAAKRLAEAAGQPNVTFYDVSNQAHTLSFTAALQVVITVAGTYQAQLAKKQQKMLAIDAAATQADLDAIVW